MAKSSGDDAVVTQPEGNPNFPDAGPPNAPPVAAPPAEAAPTLATEFEAAATGLFSHAKELFSGTVNASSIADVEAKAIEFVNAVLALIRTTKA